ncbi:MAG: hypothetical protein HRT58_20720 [Crocinitomicaceae bacterium]|nr:hypothetical protein [Flavobacteriales bacterium]NQZ38096.1 hypothetical protein [Crocinitomicaceae bacterium]
MKFLIAFAIMIGSQTSYSQVNEHHSFSQYLGVGVVAKSGLLDAVGLSFLYEPKFEITRGLSLHPHIEGNTFLYNNFEASDLNFKTATSFSAAFLLKSQYAFGKKNLKPLIAFSVGYYYQKISGGGGDGYHVHLLKLSTTPFGIAPEIGLTFGNSTISATYNFIFGQDEVLMSYYQEGVHRNIVSDLSRDYFTIHYSHRLANN